MISETSDKPSLNFILLAGPAGSGKTAALSAFSDLGFYCIDNLPVALFPEFLTMASGSSLKFGKTVLHLDIDSRDKLTALLKELESCSHQPLNILIVYLDCANDKILKRYSETRRPHPGYDPTRDKSLLETIQREKLKLQPLKELASIIIDTTALNVHQLRRAISNYVDSLTLAIKAETRINFCSFGYKYGIPLDCDSIFDVRFLPNPHFVPELKEHTGLERSVSDYVLSSAEGQEFINTLAAYLNYVIPKQILEGKAYINIGIGCTGGRHRSVAIAEYLAATLKIDSTLVSTNHRDVHNAVT